MASFFAIMMEIGCGSLGIIFPGTFFLSFYLTACSNKTTGIVIGAVTCVISEVFLGRNSTTLPLLIPLTLYAKFWSLSADRNYQVTQFISGALIGFCYQIFCCFGENLHLSYFYILRDISFIQSIIITTSISAIGLPIMLLIFEFTSRKIDMNIFRAHPSENAPSA